MNVEKLPSNTEISKNVHFHTTTTLWRTPLAQIMEDVLTVRKNVTQSFRDVINVIINSHMVMKN